MAQMTRAPQQGRHHAPIQSRIYSQTLLLEPSVLRAFLVQKIGSRITPDISTEMSTLDLVHSDVCGPMPHQSLDGASYYVSFIEDSTQKVWAYLIRTKDRVFSILSDWLAMVENQYGRKLKCLWTDVISSFDAHLRLSEGTRKTHRSQLVWVIVHRAHILNLR